MLHNLCNSTSTKISEHFKLFSQRLQNLGGKDCQKCVFFSFQISSKIALWTKFAEVKESKPSKMDKNVLKLAILLLLRPEIPRDILKSCFSFNSTKSNLLNLCGLDFRFACNKFFQFCPKFL